MATIYERIEAGEFDVAIRPIKRSESFEEWRKAQVQAEAAFRAALWADHGMTPGHPLAKQIFSLAWDLWHGDGLGGVANGFGDLALLWDTAVAHGMQTEMPALTTPAPTT